jgi:hypothetical protein
MEPSMIAQSRFIREKANQGFAKICPIALIMFLIDLVYHETAGIIIQHINIISPPSLVPGGKYYINTPHGFWGIIPVKPVTLKLIGNIEKRIINVIAVR